MDRWESRDPTTEAVLARFTVNDAGAIEIERLVDEPTVQFGSQQAGRGIDDLLAVERARGRVVVKVT